MKDSSYVTNLLREEYVKQNEKSAISPVELANNVYNLLDPRRHAPPEVQNLAILELRQLARQICADRYREQEAQIERNAIYEQQELFEGLQHRYPTKRGDDDAYVLLGDLTEAEGRGNAARLRQEGRAKIGHADALDAYFDKKFGGGPGKFPVRSSPPHDPNSQRKAN